MFRNDYFLTHLCPWVCGHELTNFSLKHFTLSHVAIVFTGAEVKTLAEPWEQGLNGSPAHLCHFEGCRTVADRDCCIVALAGIWVFSPCCWEKPALEILGPAPRADGLTVGAGVEEKGPGNILSGTWFRNKGGKRAANMNDNHQSLLSKWRKENECYVERKIRMFKRESRWALMVPSGVEFSMLSDPQQPFKQTSPRQLGICGQLDKYLYTNNFVILWK